MEGGRTLASGQRAGRAPMIENPLESRARSALANCPIHEIRELRVLDRNGMLVMEGRVSSFYHKQLAQEVVLSVCKGARLANLIQVQELDDASVSWIR